MRKAAVVDDQKLIPAASQTQAVFLWNDDIVAGESYAALGKAIAVASEVYRHPRPLPGLLLVNESQTVTAIDKGSDLVPLLADRVPLKVFKRGKPSGSMISTAHLNAMLRSNQFLKNFLELDEISSTPLYLPNFELTEPGYNDGGPGHRVLYLGDNP